MSPLSSSISMLFLLATTRYLPATTAQPVAISQQDCDAASERWLEIEVLPPVDTIPGYESLSVIVEPARKPTTMEGGYWNYERQEGTKFTRCIPQEECFRVQAQLFVLGRYDGHEPRYLMDDKDIIVRLDGEAVPLSPAYPYTGDGSFVVAEVGDCDVECGPGTTLLEIEGTPNLYHSFGWRLEDTGSGENIVSCLGSWSPSNSEKCDWNMAEYFNPKVCLPSNGCYRLVAGSAYGNAHETEAVDHFNATFGGERLATWSNVQFEAVDFASPTSYSQCNNHGPCERDNEDLVEFFLWRDYNRTWQEENPDLEWALKSATPGSVALAEGVVSKPTQAYDLTYERKCVSRDACYQLEFAVPPTTSITEDFLGTKKSISYWEEDLYRVVMNGKIYNSRDEYTFGVNPYYTGMERPAPKFREVVFLGECEQADVCLGDQESLLEINFATGGTRENWLPYHAGWSLRDVSDNKHDETWFGSAGTELQATNDGTYHMGETYRHYECVTLQDTCLEFGVDTEAIDTGSVVEEYSLLLNGQEKTKRREWNSCEGPYHCGLAVVTRIGGDSCPSPIQLAPGPIAGIVLSSIGAVGVLVFFFITRCRGGGAAGATSKTSLGRDVEVAEATTTAAEEESPVVRIPAESEELPYIKC